jgi:hypothetical protein
VDFLLKQGGGPGAIAKHQARLYGRLMQEHPSATNRDILTMMYIARAEAGSTIPGHKGKWYRGNLPCDPAAIERFRNAPNLTIRDLIDRIIDAEDPNSAVMPIEVKFKILQVVVDVLDEELPGWREDKITSFRGRG